MVKVHFSPHHLSINVSFFFLSHQKTSQAKPHRNWFHIFENTRNITSLCHIENFFLLLEFSMSDLYTTGYSSLQYCFQLSVSSVSTCLFTSSIYKAIGETNFGFINQCLLLCGFQLVCRPFSGYKTVGSLHLRTISVANMLDTTTSLLRKSSGTMHPPAQTPSPKKT